MPRGLPIAICFAVALTGVAGCTSDSLPSIIEPGPEAQRQAQAALIAAQPGDVVEFAEGRFQFDSTLSLDVEGVTIRGQGREKTIFDFSNQAAGSGGEGLMVTADDFTAEDLAVFNSRSDGIKVEGTRGATFRRVFVNWEGPPKTENGAYGLYPVQVRDVLIDDCWVRGSSDAGIYVGQSENIIVRNNRTWENVAGIEIENSVGADVYGNEAFNNTGGILVFSLPELPVKAGRNARIYDNEIYDNNHPNFGKEGAIVSTIPAGSGIILMASDNIEVFRNELRDNQNTNLSVLSFLATQRAYNDPDYDPYTEGVSIYENSFSGGGSQPAGALADAVGSLVGETFPDIVFDGIVDPEKLVDGKLPPELGFYLGDNGEATFVNLDLSQLLVGGKPKLDRSVLAYAGALPEPLAPVTMGGH